LACSLASFRRHAAGRRGTAPGLVFPPFIATTIGIIAWIPDIHAAGAGVVTFILSALVCWYGGRFGRRLTCFAAAATSVLGVYLVVGDASPNNQTAAGIAFILVGIVVAAGAAALGTGLREPDDMAAEAVA